jgi:hypothetical protein
VLAKPISADALLEHLAGGPRPEASPA